MSFLELIGNLSILRQQERNQLANLADYKPIKDEFN